MTVKSLLVKISAETTGLEAGLKKAQKSIEAHAATFRKVGTAMTVAGGAITTALGLTVKKTVDLGEEIYELSQKTGISTELLSGYRLASEMAGISLETFARTMGILAKNMVSFDVEAQETNAALQALGISTTQNDGSLKSLDTIMLEVADKFKAMEDGALKAAMAKKIFGRAGMELIPVLNLGSEGLREIYDQAQKTGMVFSKEAAEGCNKFADSNDLLQESVKGLGVVVATSLMPTLTPLIEKITQIIQGITSWAGKHPGLLKVLVPLVGAVGVLGTVLGPILIMLPGLAIAFGALTGPIGIVAAAVAGLIAVGTLVVTHWTEIKAFFVTIWEAIAGFFVGIFERIKLIFSTAWEAIKTGISTVFETIKTIIQVGWEAIVGIFNVFKTAVWEIVQALIQGIIDKFTWLFRKIGEIVGKIKDVTVGAFKSIWKKVTGGSIVPDMVAGVISNFMTMKTGIGTIMGEVETGTKTIFGNISDYASAMETASSGAFKGMGESLKESGRAIMAMLEKQAIGYIITQVMAKVPFPLNLVLVGVAIAAVKALFSAVKFAKGGIVKRPTLAMIGERGPEAVIPLDRPGALAFAGGGVTLRQSNYFYGNINNAGDLDEISRRLAERTIRAISKGRR